MKLLHSRCHKCVGNGELIYQELAYENNIIEHVEVCEKCDGTGLAYNGVKEFILYYFNEVKLIIKNKWRTLSNNYSDGDLPF